MWRFVAEDGAVDSLLPAVVDKLAPDEHRVCDVSSQDDVLAGSDELTSPPTVTVSISGVVSLIEREARFVAILRDVPERGHAITPPSRPAA